MEPVEERKEQNYYNEFNGNDTIPDFNPVDDFAPNMEDTLPDFDKSDQVLFMADESQLE
jgi:hypothetical protein